MATQTLTTPKQKKTAKDKIQQLRQLYADAPEFAKSALRDAQGPGIDGGAGRDHGWKAQAGPACVRARSRS
jgi:hypothetical protein